MAKFEVKKTFRDVHTKELYEKGSIIDMTVKRAGEVEKNLDQSFLQRVDEKKK
ncbi:hypothetical protein ACWOE3_07885 [Enterococcus dispar]|uniref:Uncharacterized protein n=1 Tax=Enterococcus dispar ATCC 51266 TaxID=1139219 RepID=S0KDK6_9ENTE|nr:hypothetical protein [Enterococcus dispar]EOT38258.1 hypothetical protein OMK_02526 [Enterococcus dispar ATCC 51266]EOW86055.1 hypothetical protein I569_01378 [Enterococcus dispar ATCC 51266]MCU7356258.1 hypothetical protein [Enterococcus dispar]